MKVMLLVGTAMAKNPEENFMFCVRKARERLARSNNRPDFTSHDQQEIESNSQVLINVGTEPVATAICGIFFHLVSHPHALVRAVGEVRSAFTSESDITIASTAQPRLPYLAAVIEEGMRMYPPAPSTFPRRNPPGGCTICGRLVPGGNSVGVNQSAVMRSKFAADDKTAYQPFSYGPRSCIGKRLAWAEMRLILSRNLWRFDPEISTESKSWNVGQKTNAFWEKFPCIVLRPATRSR
ncbi:hypothetical protein MFIFM68171_09438 [Madurella fahalii]|uniref:Cytochrome P450 n=1 Tax=Madurella fahalii TaxID=1157608 RepID=A0ABQ0GN84_9PEZI